jgi:micrococcal nuclease
MKKFKILICLLFLCVPCLAQFNVVKCYDGDSFEVIEATTGKTLQVRLAYLDSPEEGQPFYNESKAYLEKLILNKLILLSIHNIDNYGRTIADIWVNEKWVNKEMIIKGMSFVYPTYCKDPNLYNAEFVARSQGIGVWSQKYAIRPWTFRARKHYKG